MPKSQKRDFDQQRKSIAPFRAYEICQATSGERCFVVRTGASPDQPPVEILVTKGAVITPNEVVEWPARLPFKLSVADASELASALNLMRVTVHAKDAAPFHREAAIQRILKYIDGLIQELPEIINFGRENGSTGAAATLDALELSI